MAQVTCARCSKEKEGLPEAPFENELGNTILKRICQDCWQEWVGQQLMLMNEYMLDPTNDEHSRFLDDEMKKFLQLSDESES